MNIIDRIKQHEGYRDRLYLDTEGKLTGGWGHHFAVGSYIPHYVSERLLYNDIYNARKAFERIAKDLELAMNDARRDVCIEMIFNLGASGFTGFKKMLAALKAQDWEGAAREMMDSKWARQVKGRAVTLSHIMMMGEE
jgi:lysozyme